MSRRSSQQNQTAPTLFPFLAVLICTMGAIIVLLVLVVKRADIQANKSEQAVSAEEIAEQKQQLSDKLEFSKNNISMLNSVRPQLKDRLESEKALYGHLTSHIAELANELTQLKKQMQTMAATDSSGTDQAQLNRQLSELTVKIEEEKQKLARKRNVEKNQKQTFAIIPHTTGGNGTFRRPIFVECDGDGVTLQPYGITLRANDFPNPMAAGNPLDAALVMIRDYWNQIDPNHKEGQPYPLFVVRPSGSKSFAAGRKAMKSWVDEFGYELVTAEVEIAYPKTDETFKNQLVSAVSLARQRQQATIAAINRTQAMRQIRQLENGSGQGDGSGGGASSGGYRASSITGGFVREPGGSRTSGRLNGNSSFASSKRSTSDATSSDPSFKSESNSSQLSRGSKFGTNPLGQPSDRNSRFEASRNSPFGGPQNNKNLSGNTNPFSGNPTSSSNQNNSGGSNSGPNGNSGPDGNSSAASGQTGGQELPQESIARTRGSNWALPSKANNSIQIRKPIKILVNENEIQIVEIGKGIKSISFANGSETAVPTLVEQVWQHIDAWGIAGVNSYWKPVLNVYVSPNADGRFRELKNLLSGSGLDLRRVQ